MLSLKKSITIKIVKLNFFRRILIFNDLNYAKKNVNEKLCFYRCIFYKNLNSFWNNNECLPLNRLPCMIYNTLIIIEMACINVELEQ